MGPAAGPRACDGGDTARLAVFQSVVVSCSFGSTITLPANGASYLVVPQFATAAGKPQAVDYSISATGAVASARSAPARIADDVRPLDATALFGTHPRPGARQREFSHALMRRAAQDAASGRRQPLTSGTDLQGRPSAHAVAQPDPPPLGTSRRFFVVTGNNDIRNANAQLRYIGDNILLYMDETTPANGFTPAQLDNFGRLFDRTLFKLVVDVFGGPSDIDQNGRVIMLLTPRVNAMTPAAECESAGYVAGFFNGADLLSGLASNGGEVFYGAVPDVDGVFSCPHSVGGLGSITPAVFMHELQHLISFSQRVVARNASPEAGWLDEGLSLLAEELGSIHFEKLFPAPSGRTRPTQLFPDSSALFIADLSLNSYEYLLYPETHTLLLHEAHDGGIAWRGGEWLFARWLADHYGVSLFRKLMENKATGTANLEAATGEAFRPMFGRFALSLYTDSLPGISKTAVPAQTRFLSRTLRRIYQAYSVVVDLPRLFPIETQRITPTATTTSMVPGSMAFYRLDTGSGAYTTLTFSTRAGTYFEPELEPQVAIFRLPPGQ